MEYDPEVLDGKGGDVIAFYSERDGNSEIYIMNADGGAETRLTNNVDQDITPVLSTDGSQILFVSNRGGQRDIYRMKYDGTNVTRQTNNSGNNFWPSWALSDGIQ